MPSCDMFQQKIDKTFKDLPNVFGIADDILILGYDADSKRPWHNPEMSNADMTVEKSK